QAARAKRRSSVSPAFLISRGCMSTQTLQPLIWLARRWTRPSVRVGTPPASEAALSACRAFMASGTRSTGVVILASKSLFLLDFVGGAPGSGTRRSAPGHIDPTPSVTHDDGARPGDVTWTSATGWQHPSRRTEATSGAWPTGCSDR